MQRRISASICSNPTRNSRRSHHPVAIDSFLSLFQPVPGVLSGKPCAPTKYKMATGSRLLQLPELGWAISSYKSSIAKYGRNFMNADI